MKYFKILIFILISGILFLIISSVSYASEYYFIWENTTVVVPLYGNISQYQTQPKATLYFNGEKVKNQEISYLRTGGELYFLDDVDTTIVGKYLVLYKAYDYNIQTGNCDGYSQIITFDVKDLEAPKLSIVKKDVTISYRQTEYDFTTLVSATDNAIEVTPQIDQSEVNFGRVGVYNVYVYVNDGYNIVTDTIKVNIVDEDVPIVEFLGDINCLDIPYQDNLAIDFYKYFKAVDEYDGNVIQSLEISDYEIVLEEQYLTAKVSDSSGNEAYCYFKLNIYDSVAPTLKLISNSVTINIENFEELDYFSFITDVSDNYSDLTKDDVKVIGNVKKEIGEYIISYSVTDDELNETTKELSIIVKSNSGPKVVMSEANIMAGDSFNPLDYITITDLYDELAASTFKIIDTNLNTYKKGTYYINFSVHNTSGNYTYETLIVNVVEANKTSTSIEYDNKNLIFIVFGVIFFGFIIVYYKKSRRKL